MESTRILKRIKQKYFKKGVVKKELNKVNKVSIEIAEMKFENTRKKGWLKFKKRYINSV